MCVRPGEIFHTMVAQDRDRSRGADGHGEQGIRTQVPGASVGEDRAILLGYTMMAFSVLMFFVVGITMIKPFVNRYTGECCLVSRLSYKCIPSLKACSPRVCAGDSRCCSFLRQSKDVCVKSECECEWLPVSLRVSPDIEWWPASCPVTAGVYFSFCWAFLVIFERFLRNKLIKGT